MSSSEYPNYNLTEHAREEAKRRGIPLDLLKLVLDKPDQIVDAHSGRKVYQSQVEMDGKLYLIRAIIEEINPVTVVTVYRTSNIKKYWSAEP